jgi:hypothetical protein
MFDFITLRVPVGVSHFVWGTLIPFPLHFSNRVGSIVTMSVRCWLGEGKGAELKHAEVCTKQFLGQGWFFTVVAVVCQTRAQFWSQSIVLGARAVKKEHQ